MDDIKVNVTYKSMTKYNKKVGKFGETLAKKWLIKHGYKIIGANIQVGKQEIDILAKIKEKYVFFEVKTRVSDKYGTAEDMVNRKKIRNLKKALIKYAEREKIDENDLYLDLLAIDIKKQEKTANIKHYKNII